jgi:hypothetical protein
MKHVVTIGELHKLIPETKKLEGVNFKDMKTLISTVITKVEESGNWEYVQYISGSPSLFVVKEKEVPVYQTPPQYSDAYAEINAHYNQSTIRNNDIENRKIKSGKAKNVEPSKKERKSEPIYTPMQEGGATLFPETRMPW